MKIHHNIERINYLLALFQMSEDELLAKISEGLKNPIKREEIWGQEIKVSNLKKIDEIFKKGIQFYLDPTTPKIDNSSSIFFRKTELGSTLNLGAKQIVNQFEETSFSLSALAKLSDVIFERMLPRFLIQHDPKEAGREIREKLNPAFKAKPKDYLIEIIRVLAEVNIMVFEYVESWNKVEKSNIDGFFLKPNVIVLKRNQKSFRREIFTLVHELGHYLLDEEVAEEVNHHSINSGNNKIEKWCNEFAYYFISYRYDELISDLDYATKENDFHNSVIQDISNRTHLSKMSIFTRLLINEKISPVFYNIIKSNLQEEFIALQEEEKKKRELDKEMGKPSAGSIPVPIKSPLLVSTYQKAYFEGALSEYEFCKRLNIKSENFEKYIYDSSI